MTELDSFPSTYTFRPLASANQATRLWLTMVITTSIRGNRMESNGHEVLFHRGGNKPHIQQVLEYFSQSFDKNVKQTINRHIRTKFRKSGALLLGPL
jgi:hypothetical protein